MEISGGVSQKIPEYMVYGTKGSIIGTGRTLSLKYLDPSVELADIKANPETPLEGAAYGNGEKLAWIEEKIELSAGDDTNVIWDHLYEAHRNNIPYPITSAQALAVVKVLEDAKIGTEFAK